MKALKIARGLAQGVLVLMGSFILLGMALAPVTRGYSLGLSMLAAFAGAPALAAFVVLTHLTDKA